MSTKETIESLYRQYLNNDISKEELESFLEMLDTPEGEVTISDLINGTWEEMFETRGAKVIPFSRRLWFRMAAAVVIIILFSAGGYLLMNQSGQKPRQLAEDEQKQVHHNDLEPGGNKAVLTLADGTKIILDSTNEGTVTKQGDVTVIKLNNGQLAYHSPALSSQPPTVLYNTISTPKGGQYQLELADGSKVWLNAASSLTFPATFTAEERAVTLTGEAYFEVTKDVSKPFRVTAGDISVEVLGTEFNINAYDDESSIRATLLEGSVNVKSGNQAARLAPGEQARFITSNRQLRTVKDVDVNSVVAWKNGFFSFNNASLKDVMRQIARWYDVDVQYEGDIAEREFGGKIDRNSNASQVLKILEESNVHFRIEGKKIIVMP